MALNLSTYNHIYTAVFVRLAIPGESVIRMSTHYKPLTIVESDSTGYTYTNLGDLLLVGDTTSNIRANPEEITVTIAGVPNTSISEFINLPVKGSTIEVRRAYFNGSTWQQISVPVISFKGIVNNYSITEDYPTDGSQTAASSIGLICSTLLDLYENKQAGRRTNPLDHQTYYPNDPSMNRVPTITGSSFNFGAAR